MPAERIIETKRMLDGRRQTFACDALHMTPRLAVVHFAHTVARTAGGFTIVAGSYTLGFFWRARPYNCYRFTAPSGSVVAYRFDVVDRVTIRPGQIGYRDLLLDFYVSPTGAVTVEDEDEVAAALSAGVITPALAQRIAATRRLLERNHARIIAEVEAAVGSLDLDHKRDPDAAARAH